MKGWLVYPPSGNSVKSNTKVERPRDISRVRATLQKFGGGSDVTMKVAMTVMVRMVMTMAATVK